MATNYSVDTNYSVEKRNRSGARFQSRLLVRAIFIAGLVLFLDQLSKAWAVNRLEVGPCDSQSCISIFGGLARFRLHYNTGAAFGRGQGIGPIIGVVALVMVLYLLWLASRTTERFPQAMFALIAGGAAGNVADRLFRSEGGILSGAVVDFIDVGFIPIFNLADSAIDIGVVLLLLSQTSFWRKSFWQGRIGQNPSE